MFENRHVEKEKDRRGGIVKIKIDEAYNFLRSDPLAVVGVSSTKKNFGVTAYQSLKSSGCAVAPVNPKMDTFEGDKCYPSLSAFERTPEGAVLIVQPEQTLSLVEECHKLGIKKVWFQQGSSNDDALEYCRANGITAFDGQCILMFSGIFPHNIHLFLWKLFGKVR